MLHVAEAVIARVALVDPMIEKRCAASVGRFFIYLVLLYRNFPLALDMT